VPLFEAESAKLGHAPGPVYTGLNWVHVSDTPAKTRKQLEPHLFHYCMSYAGFAKSAASSSPFEGLKTIEDIWNSGLFMVVTPSECAKIARDAQKFDGRFQVAPLIAGLSPKIGWKSLELLVDKVLPQLGHGKKKPATRSAASARSAKTKPKAKRKAKAKGKKRR
jgi:hypothetical protein